MARPRKVTDNPPVDVETPGLPALVEAGNERARQLIDIDEQYGSGLPYDRERVIHEFHIHVGNASNSLIEAGKCVILIREHEPRGDFDRLVEERLNMSRASAYKFMGATRRLLELDPKTVQPVGRLGQTKLLDLMVEADNEDLEELADGGTFAGMTLGEMECMTKRELKQALLEAREENAAKDKVLAEKNTKIDSLATQLEKSTKKGAPKWAAMVIGMAAEISEHGNVVDEVLGKHLTFITACEALADNLDMDEEGYLDKLEQARVPISRISENLERFAHLVARLRFEFDNRVGGYLDKSHTLDPAD